MTSKTNTILNVLGLQTRTKPSDFLKPAMGVFGAGLAMGAGAALLFAPKKGSELRGDIKRGAIDAGSGVSKAARSIGSKVGETAGSVGTSISSAAHAVKVRVMPGPSSEPATAELDAMTRDELYAQAQTLQIDGRSDMTKDELLHAVQTAHVA